MTLGYAVAKDTTYKATEGGGDEYRPFKPLEAASVVVSIFEATAGEYKNGGNKGRTNVRIQFKVSEGQKGANKRLFQTVGIFEKWAPTSKNPDGFDNFTFFDLFAAATGKANKEFRQWFEETADPFAELPSPKQLEGRKVVATLKIVNDEYAYTKALTQFAQEKGLDLAADRAAVEAAFEDEHDLTQDDYKTNEIASFKVYDGTLPSAGGANTSAPKVAAVDL